MAIQVAEVLFCEIWIESYHSAYFSTLILPYLFFFSHSIKREAALESLRILRYILYIIYYRYILINGYKIMLQKLGLI